MEPLVTPAAATISLTDALSYPFSANSRVAAATNRRRTAGSCVRAIRAPSLALAAPGSIPSGRYGGKGYGQRAARHRPAPADRLARRAVPGPAGRATPGTGDRRRPLQPHLRGPPQWTVDGAPPAAAGPRARHRPRHAPRVHGADRARPHAGTRPPHARLLRRPRRHRRALLPHGEGARRDLPGRPGAARARLRGRAGARPRARRHARRP